MKHNENIFSIYIYTYTKMNIYIYIDGTYSLLGCFPSSIVFLFPPPGKMKDTCTDLSGTGQKTLGVTPSCSVQRWEDVLF